MKHVLSIIILTMVSKSDYNQLQNVLFDRTMASFLPNKGNDHLPKTHILLTVFYMSSKKHVQASESFQSASFNMSQIALHNIMQGNFGHSVNFMHASTPCNAEIQDHP